MLYTCITLLITAVLVAVDQGIKYWAVTALAPVGTMPLLPGVVQLRFVLNDGAAFSMLGGHQGVLITFTAVALAAILAYLFVKRPARKLEYTAWVLVLSGGIGNLIDRVLNRVVVDYLDLQFMEFAVFNFADILVCVGIGLLLLDLILDETAKKKNKDRGEKRGTV